MINSKKILPIMEESFFLLKEMKIRTLLIYYIGSMPFIIYFIYFLSVMAYHGKANEHIIEMTIIISFLYLWMKTWQSFYCHQVMSFLYSDLKNRIQMKTILKAFIIQTIYQPIGLLLSILSIVVLFVPLFFIYPLFQNLQSLAFNDSSIKTIVKKAFQFTFKFKKQGLLLFLMTLFIRFIVVSNIAIIFFFVPYLLKTLFSVDIFLTLDNFYKNITFYGVILGFSYVIYDPFLKIFYLIRNFYIESVHQGHDLLYRLKNLRIKQLLLLLLFLFVIKFSGYTDNNKDTLKPVNMLKSEELEKAIKKTLENDEYSWRRPVEREEYQDDSMKELSFMTEIKDFFKKVEKYLKDFFEKIFKNSNEKKENSPVFDLWNIHTLIIIFFVLVSLFILFFLGRILYQKYFVKKENTIDYQSENSNIPVEEMAAMDLAQNEWLLKAREWLQSGNLRFAVRAYYNAFLVDLNENGLIILQRHKTNGEYQKELKIRSRNNSNVINKFRMLSLVFEDTWYGLYEVTNDKIQQIKSIVEGEKSA